MCMAFHGIRAILNDARVTASKSSGDNVRAKNRRHRKSRKCLASKRVNCCLPPSTCLSAMTIVRRVAWKYQSQVLQSAVDFQSQGGRLVRLEFPRTEIQRFGEVAILYSKYIVETEMKGKHSISSGRATEVFVLQNGQWTNPGWHTDAEK